jgi:hypothetical protein
VESKKLNAERAGPTRLLPGLAGADLIFQWIGMGEYIPYLLVSALAGKYLFNKISKSGQGQHSG